MASDAAPKLLPTRFSRVSIALVIVVGILVPFVVSGDFWMTVLVSAGIFAMGAVGLNLLTGFTGQVSLGHAFFLGCGAYTAAYLGADQGWPLPLWLIASGVIGGVVGGIVGPFALRLKGNYLVVVTLGLVFIGIHIFENWDRVTGGRDGTSTSKAELSLGFTDFRSFSVPGKDFSELQGLYYLVWILAGLFVLVSANIVRSRPGRALQAIRDRDVAAEVVGISLPRYKIGAFVISSAMAAMAGAMLGVQQSFVTPGSWDIFLSIQYVAVIIVGGVGMVSGAVLGALLLSLLPEIVKKYSEQLPFLYEVKSDGGILSVAAFNEMLFGALLVVFLLFEPRGLAALWLRAKTRLRTTRPAP